MAQKARHFTWKPFIDSLLRGAALVPGACEPETQLTRACENMLQPISLMALPSRVLGGFTGLDARCVPGHLQSTRHHVHCS